jgi:hypothetical protein
VGATAKTSVPIGWPRRQRHCPSRSYKEWSPLFFLLFVGKSRIEADRFEIASKLYLIFTRKRVAFYQ